MAQAHAKFTYANDDVRSIFFCFFALLVQACALTASVPESSASQSQPIDDSHLRPAAHVIVKPAAAVSEPNAESFRRELSAASGCEVAFVRAMGGRLYLFRVSNNHSDSLATCVDRLNKLSSVEFAELDSVQKAF